MLHLLFTWWVSFYHNPLCHHNYQPNITRHKAELAVIINIVITVIVIVIVQIGHSMGGGIALAAAATSENLKLSSITGHFCTIVIIISITIIIKSITIIIRSITIIIGIILKHQNNIHHQQSIEVWIPLKVVKNLFSF